MKLNQVIAFAFTAAAALCSAGGAMADSPVSSRLDALQVISGAAGKEELVPAGQVKPGDVIEYRLVYQNSGAEPVSQLAVNGPVPKGTMYIVNTAASPVKHDLKFSYDGAQSWVLTPPIRIVRSKDGTTHEQPAGAEEITNIEWVAREPLKTGAEQVYRYRVKVLEEQQQP